MLIYGWHILEDNYYFSSDNQFAQSMSKKIFKKSCQSFHKIAFQNSKKIALKEEYVYGENIIF